MGKILLILIFFIISTIISESLAQMSKTIIVGTTYNIFHEEFSNDKDFFKQVDVDIPLIKKININHIMIFPMNQWNQSTKKISWKRTDYIIKKIEDADIKFVPIMLKEEQTSYYFPIWKFREIKGMWNKYNLNNGNENNRDNIDFANPRIFPLVKEYFKKVIGRYGKSPSLSFYNIWNEPHYSSTSPQVIKKFIMWLQKKYGNLEVFSKAWGEAYNNWDDVSPFLIENWHSSMPQIDWIIFRNELNGEILGKLTAMLRKYDPMHPVNANPVGTTWTNFNEFGNYNVDNWVFTDKEDIQGISYYPDSWEREHNLKTCPFWLHNLTFNTIRCASVNKNYILTELYTNAQNGLALNGYLDKNFVKDLAWTALSNDCKGIIYWKWKPFMRGRQSLGRGLTTIDGKLAASGKAVKEFGSVINKYGNILYRAHPIKAQAAILVDIVGLVKTLEQKVEPLTTKFMYESNAGLFKSLFEANIPVDILRMDLNLNLKTLLGYKIIFLPFQIVMRRNVAELLKMYVKHGGCVVADARTATLDELDFAYKKSPGAELDELFGAIRESWVGQKKFYKVKIYLNNAFRPLQFEGKYFLENIKPQDSTEVIGRFIEDDKPAVLKNHYGNGTAILSAVPLGASYYDKPDNQVNKVIQEFALQSGVIQYAKFISNNNNFIDIKIHTLNDTLIVYAINSDDFLKNGKIELYYKNKKIKEVKDILSDKNLKFEQSNETISIQTNFKQYQVMVLLID